MARLTGQIIAIDWDETDEPTEIALETEDGDRYMIARNSQHEELVRYVGQDLELEGKIEEPERGEPIIKVRRFEALELTADEEPEEYDQEEDIPEDEL